MTSRLPLPSVTLCCVDTRHAAQAWYALERCVEPFAFGQALFFCPEGWGPPGAGLECISLQPTPALRSIEDYNRFMLKGLASHVATAHVLVVQWDGFICHPDRWDDAFLEWDYIGAPWYHGGSAGTVGNGGFSLRSRKLLTALEAIDHPATEPEDMAICVTLRHRLESEFGIRFAPLDVAQKFACEYGPYRTAFGFHGMHNFAHVLDAPTLRRWLESCPVEMLCTKHARKLVKALMQNGRAAEAIQLQHRRLQAEGLSLDNANLMLRAISRLIHDKVK